MGIKRNAVNGWLTTILGTITTLFTLYQMYNGSFDFVWDGIIGLSIGVVMIIAPRTIERKFSDIIDKATGGKKEDEAPKLKD